MYPTTTSNPRNESGLAYCIKITDKVLPNNDGKNESNRSQLPQHPKGTREKNENKELIAVLPELPTNPFLCLEILQPKLFP